MSLQGHGALLAGDDQWRHVAKTSWWSYDDPLPESERISGLVSFYNEKTDIYIDELRQRGPRPNSSEVHSSCHSIPAIARITQYGKSPIMTDRIGGYCGLGPQPLHALRVQRCSRRRRIRQSDARW